MMETKEIYKKLHQFVDEVSLGYKGTIDLNLLREAADRLKAMDTQIYQHREEIADLEKQLAENQPEWINVADRLPEANKNYLIYTHLDRVDTAYFLRESEWTSGGITHWMPLPEPPKLKEPTFKDVFLKAFPKAEKRSDSGIPCIVCCSVFPYLNDGRSICQRSENCSECWNLPYFAEEGEADV